MSDIILNSIYDLLKNGSDINDKIKGSPLFHIIIKLNYPYVEDYPIFFDFFEALNFNFNSVDKHGFSILYLSIIDGIKIPKIISDKCDIDDNVVSYIFENKKFELAEKFNLIYKCPDKLSLIYNSDKCQIEIIKLYLTDFKSNVHDYFIKLFTSGFEVIIKYFQIFKYLNLDQFKNFGYQKYNYIENKINLKICYFKLINLNLLYNSHILIEKERKSFEILKSLRSIKNLTKDAIKIINDITQYGREIDSSMRYQFHHNSLRFEGGYIIENSAHIWNLNIMGRQSNPLANFHYEGAARAVREESHMRQVYYRQYRFLGQVFDRNFDLFFYQDDIIFYRHQNIIKIENIIRTIQGKNIINYNGTNQKCCPLCRYKYNKNNIKHIRDYGKYCCCVCLENHMEILLPCDCYPFCKRCFSKI